MESQHEPMMISQPSMQCIVQLLTGRLDPVVGEFSQFPRISDAVDHRLDHSPAAEADDVADDRVELDVGLFKRLLNPLDMAGLLACELLASAQQRAELLHLLFRYEARLDQPETHQIDDPHGVVHAVLRPGTFLMCLALATSNSNLPSLRIFHTGFQ